MTETKWTPGRWQVGRDSCVQDAGGMTIPYYSGWIEMAWYGGDATDESKANAHLIASAPDLYEALEALLNRIWVPEGNTTIIPATVRARAALAKARGETLNQEKGA